MKKAVYKYDIPSFKASEIQMPEGAQILSLQVQDGRPRIWALVNPEARPKAREFMVVGTGHEIERENIRHIGTWQQMDGALVWHLFEIIPGPT